MRILRLPKPPDHNTNVRLRYSKMGGNCSLRNALGYFPRYLAKSLFGKDCAMSARADDLLWLPPIVTPLCHHISRIFGCCSQEKMIGVYAGRCIAPMANEKSVWNRTAPRHPCPPVRACFEMAANADLSVSLWAYAARPQPTPSVGVEFNPEQKPLGHCEGGISVRPFAAMAAKAHTVRIAKPARFVGFFAALHRACFRGNIKLSHVRPPMPFVIRRWLVLQTRVNAVFFTPKVTNAPA